MNVWTIFNPYHKHCALYGLLVSAMISTAFEFKLHLYVHILISCAFIIIIFLAKLARLDTTYICISIYVNTVQWVIFKAESFVEQRIN